MPAEQGSYYTTDAVLAFPDDGNRYELVCGELLVSPSPVPRHERVVLRLWRIVAGYCEHHGLGEAFASRGDLTWGRSDVLVMPDVFVVGRSHAGFSTWREVRDVPLVAEVLSPSSSRSDRFTKRTLYRDLEVPTYWLLDPDAALAEVWAPNALAPQVERERLVWHPAGAIVALTVDLRRLFR